MKNNPLLQPAPQPNQAPAFAQIKVEHFLPAIKEAIKIARKNIDAIKSNNEKPDFENTIVALENASEDLGNVASIYYNQLAANGNDDLQALANEIGPINANFSSDIILDEELFKKVKAVYDQRDHLELTVEQATLLEETYSGFVRGGALLNDDAKTRLRQISEQLSVLSPAFANNVTKSAESFSLVIEDEKDLAGLPESAIEAAAQAAIERLPESENKGKWVFTLDAPSVMPFLKYAENRELREKIWRAFSSRAWEDEWDNCDNILKTVSLRNERAKLLGYETHAHFVLEKRMAETPQTVFEFLNKMINAYKKAATKDLEMLKDFAAEIGGPETLQPWDVGFYAEKLKQKLFAFSSEDLRPYFPLQNVLTGCFDHFSALFGLKFTASDKYETWHKDVQAFDVTDEKSGAFIGTFFADFYPREGKKQGAWKTSYRNQGLYKGEIERPVIAIVCNFTKPTATKPSLLTHGEVSTLFHEMGHAVHALVSDVTYSSLAGTSVLWDFVELPSQVQENWCYEAETLNRFANHYETGENIPADLIEKLRKSRNFMVGWGGLRQMSFAWLDMMWHTTDPATITDVAAFEDEHTKDTSLFPRYAGPGSTAFAHIFAGGYAAGYYSYKWAEVLDADTFELFLECGLYDRETARSYREEILARGGSQHPRILYHNFRGRDADPKALLRREDLAG